MTDLSHPPLSAKPATTARQMGAKSEHPANRRAMIVHWLHRMHGWFGLWGTVMGLIFGASGVWLNYRTMLKLPVMQQRINTQIAPPDPMPITPETMVTWLQQTLNTPEPASRIHVEKAKSMAWVERPVKGGDVKDEKNTGAPRKPAVKPLMQPEQWTFNFGGATLQAQAEYWAGNRSIAIRRTDNGFLGTLMNLHKGAGITVPRILLVDTLASCLIFLSISDLWLWAITTRRRTVGQTIFGLGSLLVLGLVILRLRVSHPWRMAPT